MNDIIRSYVIITKEKVNENKEILCYNLTIANHEKIKPNIIKLFYNDLICINCKIKNYYNDLSYKINKHLCESCLNVYLFKKYQELII